MPKDSGASFTQIKTRKREPSAATSTVCYSGLVTRTRVHQSHQRPLSQRKTTNTTGSGFEAVPWAGRVSIWLLVFALPLGAWWPGADPGVPLRLVLLGLGLGCALLWVARNRGRAASTSTLDPLIAWVGTAGLLVVCCAALASASPTLGLLGRYPKYEGLPMLASYLLVVIVGAALLGGATPTQARLRGHALTALSALEIVLTLWAMAETFASPAQRIVTPLGNASDVGVVAVVGFAVLSHIAIRQHSTFLWAGAGASALVTGFSASRGAWLALGVVTVAMLAIAAAQRLLRRAWPILLTVGVTVVAVLATPLARNRGIGTSPLANQTVEGRFLLWNETLSLWLDHLWLGVGPSRFVDEIGAYHDAEWTALVGSENPPDAPHNIVLQVVASSGVAGLTVALVFAILLGRRLWKNRSDQWVWGAALALAGAFCAYLFHFTDLWNIVPLLLIGGGASTIPGSQRTPVNWGIGLVTGFALLWGTQSMITESMLASALSHAQADAAPMIATIDRATGLKPQDPDLAWRSGHALALLSEAGLVSPQVAIERLAPTCERLPGSVECLNDLARAQLSAGDSNGATRTLSQSIRHDPVNIETILFQGVAATRLGRVTEAEGLFMDAARLRPSDPQPWEQLAWLYEREGRTLDAAQAQKRADELG